MIAKFLGILELLKSHLLFMEEEGAVDGVTDVNTHLSLTLNPNADERDFAGEWEEDEEKGEGEAELTDEELSAFGTNDSNLERG